ncbi:MAG: universal stress protein UspA related nucleotide-binding protein [halophilic archaeon J07HX64]|nr:MAG: universal stress protein UspA related nucleotide-binding protein [halophilic archaeon J07HX64]
MDEMIRLDMAHVLVPVDDEHARQGCELATELFPGEKFLLLHVINPANAAGYNPEPGVPGAAEDWYAREETETEEYLEELRAHIEQRDDDATVDHSIKIGRPAQIIVERVEQGDLDHVVMGSHGREGISRLLLGSVAETVVRKSPVPVTVVR